MPDPKENPPAVLVCPPSFMPAGEPITLANGRIEELCRLDSPVVPPPPKEAPPPDVLRGTSSTGIDRH